MQNVIFYGWEWSNLYLFLAGPLALFILIYAVYEESKVKKATYQFVAFFLLIVFAVNAKKPASVKVEYYKNAPQNFEEIEPVIPQIIQEHGKPVLLFFFARWCDSCKELEKRLALKTIGELLNTGWILIKVDVTDFEKYEEILHEKYEIHGVPGLVFYDLNGNLLKPLTIMGAEFPQEVLVSVLKFYGKYDSTDRL